MVERKELHADTALEYEADGFYYLIIGKIINTAADVGDLFSKGKFVVFTNSNAFDVPDTKFSLVSTEDIIMVGDQPEGLDA